MRSAALHFITRMAYRVERLRWFIGGTAALHLVGFVTVLSVGKDQRVPLTRSYVTWPQQGAEDKRFGFGTVAGGSVSIEALVAAFFALSAVCQAVPAAVPALWRPLSERLQTQAIQPYRFVEYAFSASCLFLIAQLINGVTDLHHVVLVFASMATVMLLGLLQELTAYYLRCIERAGGPPRSWEQFFLPHAIGWLLYVPLWYEAFDRFGLDLREIKPLAPPHWVVSFYYFLFFVFTSFGFAQAVQMVRLYRIGAADDRRLRAIAIESEYVYTLLSLVAKSVSGYFLLSGLLASSTSGHYRR